MIVGCYSMQLYCDGDHSRSRSGEFTGETSAECRRDARKAGWSFVGDRVFCRDHREQARKARWIGATAKWKGQRE